MRSHHGARRAPRRPRPGRSAPRPRPAHVPWAERLEGRELPSVVFTPTEGPETTVDRGGPKLADVPVELIFWGGYWASGGPHPPPHHNLEGHNAAATAPQKIDLQMKQYQ
jgi:hypothetical protein